MIRLLLLLIVVPTFLGCTGEDPHPEVKDPIYKDLKSRSDSNIKSIEEAKKRLAELEKNLQEAEPNSMTLKDVQKGIAKERLSIKKSEKWAKYYKIRSDRRAVVDKIVAREAASAGKVWPDPHEYSDYQVNNRLNQASRHWGERVPKLKDRLPKKPSSKEAESSPEAAITPAAEN